MINLIKNVNLNDGIGVTIIKNSDVYVVNNTPSFTFDYISIFLDLDCESPNGKYLKSDESFKDMVPSEINQVKLFLTENNIWQ